MHIDHLKLLTKAALYRSLAARDDLTNYSISLIGTFVGADEARRVLRLEEMSQRESARFKLWCDRCAAAQAL